MLSQLSVRRDTLLFLLATTAAYGFDYLFNVVSGRLLGPADFGIIVALAALGQLFVLGSRVIQTVTTHYISKYQATGDIEKSAAFFQSAIRKTVLGGAVLAFALLLFTRPIAQFFRIEALPPVAILLFTVWLMTFRPVIGGTLQGEQNFIALGFVQLTQALVRLTMGVVLIWLGLGVVGAMAALPLASFAAFLYGLYALRHLRSLSVAATHDIQFADFFQYTSYASLGLIGFAVMVNMDALLVKRFFDADVAGVYGSAITLGKIVQFFPVAIIMILFPKASQRQAANRDPAGVLPPAFGIISLVCLSVSALYFLFPQQLIQLLFGAQYQIEGPVLGLIGIAMWLLSLMNVWLNYFLSLNQTQYVPIVWIGVFLQATAFFIWHDYLWQLPLAMAVNGLWLTIAGWIAFRLQR